VGAAGGASGASGQTAGAAGAAGGAPHDAAAGAQLLLAPQHPPPQAEASGQFESANEPARAAEAMSFNVIILQMSAKMRGSRAAPKQKPTAGDHDTLGD
jgi:hypothetical protein